jgi:pimeloyl-ACP methyl ester carboxylesterase
LWRPAVGDDSRDESFGFTSEWPFCGVPAVAAGVVNSAFGPFQRHLWQAGSPWDVSGVRAAWKRMPCLAAGNAGPLFAAREAVSRASDLDLEPSVDRIWVREGGGPLDCSSSVAGCLGSGGMMLSQIWRFAGAFALILGFGMIARMVVAAEPSGPENGTQTTRLNLPTKTLGGAQFWGDLRFFHGWRIQRHVLTGHYRLIDPADVRRGWGTRSACEDRLNTIAEKQQLGPMSGTAVILLHGIIRTSKSMQRMMVGLREEGYTVVPFDYPSTRVQIQQSADYLQEVVTGLEGIGQIHFVTHSMGGLVVRDWAGRHGDSRVGRLVMLGTPNLGAQMADRLEANLLYRFLFGQSGQQLGSDPQGFVTSLPTPEFEFAVIAGQAGNPEGYNPLVPGDDDGTVSVASTRLPGATDFVAVEGLHSFLMNHPEVIDSTRRFLKRGCLRKNGQRQPIVAAAVQAGRQ